MDGWMDGWKIYFHEHVLSGQVQSPLAFVNFSLFLPHFIPNLLSTIRLLIVHCPCNNMNTEINWKTCNNEEES